MIDYNILIFLSSFSMSTLQNLEMANVKIASSA